MLILILWGLWILPFFYFTENHYFKECYNIPSCLLLSSLQRLQKLKMYVHFLNSVELRIFRQKKVWS